MDLDDWGILNSTRRNGLDDTESLDNFCTKQMEDDNIEDYDEFNDTVVVKFIAGCRSFNLGEKDDNNDGSDQKNLPPDQDHNEIIKNEEKDKEIEKLKTNMAILKLELTKKDMALTEKDTKIIKAKLEITNLKNEAYRSKKDIDENYVLRIIVKMLVVVLILGMIRLIHSMKRKSQVCAGR